MTAAGVEEFVVGRETDFPSDGSKRIVQVGGRSIGVYRANGQFYAVQNLCPHALAPICVSDLSGTMLPSRPGEWDYGMEGFVLRCPWHAWEFDVRTGEALFEIDHRRLATFPTKVEGDQVIVMMRPRKGAKAAGQDPGNGREATAA